MEFGTIGIGLIVIILCAWPVAMLMRSRTKRKNEILNALKTLADSHALHIAQQDVWNNTAIGIDNEKKHLLFVRMQNDHALTSVVDLNNIQQCNVNKSITSFGEGADRYSVIEQLALVLQPIDKSKALMVLPCYDANEDSASLTGQLQLVDKWRAILQQQLTK